MSIEQPSEQRGLLVNIGCGRRIHPDWHNLDLHSNVPGVIECDVTKGVPVADGAARAVYSAALFEHIRRPDVNGFLAECARILEPGGLIRLAVPDFRQQVEAYLEALARAEAGDATAAADREWMIIEIIDQVGRDISGGAMAAFVAGEGPTNADYIEKRIGAEATDLMDALRGIDPRDFSGLPGQSRARVRGGWIGKKIFGWLLGSPDVEQDLAALAVGRFRIESGEVHQWVYDEWSTTQILKDAGFESITAMPHGQSGIPGWSGFELEVDAGGKVKKPDLLILEGCKS